MQKPIGKCRDMEGPCCGKIRMSVQHCPTYCVAARNRRRHPTVYVDSEWLLCCHWDLILIRLLARRCIQVETVLSEKTSVDSMAVFSRVKCED